AQRTREALAVARASGVRLGRPPTVPQAVVRRIQRKRARRDSLGAIAESLNRDKVPTAQGGARWYAATVRGIREPTVGLGGGRRGWWRATSTARRALSGSHWL